MDDRTVEIYEAGAAEWAAKKPPTRRDAAQRFGGSIAPGIVRADLGSGPGSYTADLGTPVVALDAAHAMVAMALAAAPGAWGVQADLENLPFRAGSLGGAWARASYLHVLQRQLPLALAQLHRAAGPDAPIALSMKRGEYEGSQLPNDTFPGRFFACWEPEPLVEVVEGAGFVVTRCEADSEWTHLQGHRARTLPDYVAPKLRVVVCGLNPSRRAADAGFGYAGPSNRFWPAAVAAGLVTHPRDPLAMARDDGVGMTDLVKRATVGASELGTDEYRAGAARVERIVRWLEPAVVCFVGLAGYRAAVDRRAQPGVQAEPFGGAATYVMPSTSGLNARTSLTELTDHLRAALALAR